MQQQLEHLQGIIAQQAAQLEEYVRTDATLRQQLTGQGVGVHTEEGERHHGKQDTGNVKRMDEYAWKGFPPHAPRPSSGGVGIRGIKELQGNSWMSGVRPEYKYSYISVSAMEYLEDRNPEQLIAAYQYMSPTAATPGPAYTEAWKNFVSWALGLRSEGISEGHLQLGRQLYNQLRTIQTVKDHPGVKIEDIRESVEYPHRKDDVFIQAALKAKRHQTAIPPGRAQCFTCGRVVHYSSSCRVFKKKPESHPTNGFRPRRQ
ncbi:unnamed protein product [Trypanosoma congolense IL3000]|uniref:WGS project CAEQ00000000 data, annotated contig 2418 n=1 Tax=Trypanosoma congolense (strain IL3000) TaxID=1068625 RepID=F9WDY2_TRYCI|nr:unnamed protein product [Trypanosoma congolense IL3000]